MLTGMNEAGVSPNLGTFTALLDLVSKFGSFVSAKKFALSVMAEMKKLEIGRMNS